MAVQEHFEGFDAEPEEQSRSAHKRDAQAVRALAEKLAALGSQTFDSLPFPEPEIKEAIEVARAMKRISDERRRQLQYAAKLMRGCDLSELKKAVDSIGVSAKADPRAMRMEKLRDIMIERGTPALNAFCTLIYDTDRNKLRSLLKKARDEALKEEGERPAARELFKFLKAELKRCGKEIPDELLR